MKKIVFALLFLLLPVAASAAWVHDVDFTWEVTTQGDIERFDIRFGPDSNSLPIVGTAPADARAYTVVGQKDGIYYMTVTSVDTLGVESTASDTVTLPLEHLPPEMPTNVKPVKITTRRVP